jgi:hypothetical protein
MSLNNEAVAQKRECHTYLPQICQTARMESARTNLNDILPTQSLEQFWRVLMSFGISMSSNTIILITPSVCRRDSVEALWTTN